MTVLPALYAADPRCELPDPWSLVTLPGLLAGAARATADAPAFADCPRRAVWEGNEPRVLTCRDAQRSARFLAAQLHTLGLTCGERVLILMPNVVEAPLALLAVQILGAIPVPVPADLPAEALRRVAERLEASALLCVARAGDLPLGEKARFVASKVLSIRVLAGFGDHLPDGVMSLEGWAEDDAMPLPAGREPSQADPALVTLAGAEGREARLRRHGQLTAEILALAQWTGIKAGETLVSLLHPGSAATIALAIGLPLFAGVPVRLFGLFDRAAFADLLAETPRARVLAPPDFLEAAAPLVRAAGGHLLAFDRRAERALGVAGGLGFAGADERAILPENASGGELAHPLPGLLPADAAWLSRDAAGAFAGMGVSALLPLADAARSAA